MIYPTRRQFLGQSVTVGTLGASWLANRTPTLAKESSNQRKSIVMIWLAGGPSTIDLWDLKPNHKNGGPFRPISTSVPGVQLSEHLPQLAGRADRLAVLRSMTSGEGDHDRATHYLRTGYKPAGAIQFPALGSLLAHEINDFRESGDSEESLPPFIGIASTRQLSELGNGFLPQQFAPLAVVSNSDRELTVPGLSFEPVETSAEVSRQRLLDRFDSLYLSEHSGTIASSVQTARHQALRLQDPRVAKVFDLSNASNKEFERYGTSIFGRGCLLARRLVEQHIPCIEVTLPGWDAHRNNFETVKNLSNQLDRALSALIDDLTDRNLLASTLIVCHGEFGRTPHINGNFGRDHFPNAWSVMMAGGGCCDGKMIGATSEDGMEVVDRPIRIPDLIASVCHWAGVDYRKQNMSNVRRPIRIADVDAQMIKELFS